MDSVQNLSNLQDDFKLEHGNILYTEYTNEVNEQSHIIIGCPLCEEIFETQKNTDSHLRQEHLNDISLLYKDKNFNQKIFSPDIQENNCPTVSVSTSSEFVDAVCVSEVLMKSTTLPTQSVLKKPSEFRAIAPQPASSNAVGSISIGVGEPFIYSQPIPILSTPEVSNLGNIAIRPKPNVTVSTNASPIVSNQNFIQQTINSLLVDSANSNPDSSNYCNIPITVKKSTHKFANKNSEVLSGAKGSDKGTTTNILLTDLNPEWIKIDKVKKASIVVNGNKIAHSLGPLKLINLEEVKLNDVVMNRLCHGPVILEPVPEKDSATLNEEGYLSNTLHFSRNVNNSKSERKRKAPLTKTKVQRKAKRGRVRRKISSNVKPLEKSMNEKNVGNSEAINSNEVSMPASDGINISSEQEDDEN